MMTRFMHGLKSSKFRLKRVKSSESALERISFNNPIACEVDSIYLYMFWSKMANMFKIIADYVQIKLEIKEEPPSADGLASTRTELVTEGESASVHFNSESGRYMLTF